MKPHEYTNAEGNVLILKRISKNRVGHHEFKYPRGIGSKIVCHNWNPTATCGGGIHGWPWGFGLGDGMRYDIHDDIWLVLSEKPENVVGELENGLKCKAKEPIIIFEGSFKDAFEMMTKEWPIIITKILAASGTGSKLAASGDNAICIASGINSHVKIGKNGSFVLTYIENGRYKHIVAYEGKDGIQSDVWYCVKDGVLIVDPILNVSERQ